MFLNPNPQQSWNFIREVSNSFFIWDGLIEVDHFFLSSKTGNVGLNPVGSSLSQW